MEGMEHKIYKRFLMWYKTSKSHLTTQLTENKKHNINSKDSRPFYLLAL